MYLLCGVCFVVVVVVMFARACGATSRPRPGACGAASEPCCCVVVVSICTVVIVFVAVCTYW